MHPAFSVIFLTTLIGVGQGLFLALYIVEVGSSLGWVSAQDARFYFLGTLIGFAFLASGLIASFFHLGRPERAWRAAAMWRTSWLSREVIVLPAFMAAVLAYGVAHHFDIPGTLAMGAVGVALCFALFVCTAMIYACIRFLQEWASPWTLLNFIALGCASGFTLACAYALFAAPGVVQIYVAAAIVLTALALFTRAASLLRNERIRPKSSLQTAIGVKHPKIAQKAQGFIGSSFNTREFFHGRPRTVVRTVKWTFLLLVFPVPIALLTAGDAWDLPALLSTAFVAQYLGLIAERWFFFAQARHPQNLYYQSMS
ncbi:MAG TPA: DmsC/YnfH family molybdoenzyme membrane anchor subunit [Pyrinomonadaceae bacterium]|nr:DmsC/YnfH family molybdoenzyme membrane anchor subunit [Pyrinomonadaceae bacterium]